MRDRDELLADLVAYGGGWLARTRLGGSAREEFRRAWLEASALLKAPDAAAVPLAGVDSYDILAGGIPPSEPEAPALVFAPLDAVPAGEPAIAARAPAAEPRRFWMDLRDDD